MLVGVTCEYHSRGEEYGVISETPVGTTIEGRSVLLFRRDHGYHSRLEGYDVSLGEACVNC